MTKICFLLLNAYPILANTRMHEFAGGAEIEYVCLGRELIKLGYDVSFITYKERGYESPDVEQINGIEVIKTYPKYRANDLKNFLKVAYILKALRKADADIYFGYGSSGILALYSLLFNKRYIFRVSSDAIAEKGTYYSSGNTPLLHHFSSLLNVFELKRAAVVTVQTEKQKKILSKKKIESMVIRNGFIINEPFDFKKEKTHHPIVLWVGSISYIKQPQIFLKLAKLVPEAEFIMVGPKNEAENQFFKQIMQESKRVPNLKYEGFVPPSEIDIYYRCASILVNTSIYEGFPMSFIQAWLNYVPTVSLNVDPDGIIEREKLGFHSKSFGKLVHDVRVLVMNEEMRMEMGQRAREYAVKEFDVRVIARKYSNIFEHIMKI